MYLFCTIIIIIISLMKFHVQITKEQETYFLKILDHYNFGVKHKGLVVLENPNYIVFGTKDT